MASPSETVGSFAARPEANMPDFKLPAHVAQEVVSAASARWYTHGSPELRHQFETKLNTVFESPNQSSPNAQTLALAGLWAKQLTFINSEAGLKIFVRYPHHNEPAYGLSSKIPDRAVEEIIIGGIKVFEDEDQSTAFLEWREALLATGKSNQPASVAAGAIALKETGKTS